jgi:hypothetical protein
VSDPAFAGPVSAVGQCLMRHSFLVMNQAMAPRMNVTAMTAIQTGLRSPGNSAAGVRAASVRQ